MDEDFEVYDEASEEFRRVKRQELKNELDNIQAQKTELRTVGSDKLAQKLRQFHEIIDGVEKPRELYLGSSVVAGYAGAVLSQWDALGDRSTRFNWQDFSTATKSKFSAGAEEGINWEKLGSESRMLFNCVASFNTMVGPIHKEERQRKMAVRRQRDDLSAVKVTTAEEVQNDADDGNDEATNARVTRMYELLDSFGGKPFDLLKILVDPVNPVQSVENFFDFAYLHKVRRTWHALIPSANA